MLCVGIEAEGGRRFVRRGLRLPPIAREDEGAQQGEQKGGLSPSAPGLWVELFDHDGFDRDRSRARCTEDLPCWVTAAGVRWREARGERGDRYGTDVRGFHPGGDVLRVRALLGRLDFDPFERSAHGRRIWVSVLWASCHGVPDHIGQTGDVVKPLIGLPPDWGRADHHVMEQCASGIQVDRGVEGLAAEELRRHVGHRMLARSSVRRVGAGLWVCPKQRCDPDADHSCAEFPPSLAGHDDVLWGEVAMHQCLGVPGIEGIENVGREPKHREGAQRAIA